MPSNKYLLLALLFQYTWSMDKSPLNEHEQTFMSAAVAGDVETLQQSLPKVSINTRDQFGETALFKAVYHRKWNAAEFLLRQGIDVNLHPHNNGNNTTFLHRLCQWYSSERDRNAQTLLLSLALERGANLNPLNKYYQTPLDEAYGASQYEKYDENSHIIGLLIKAGALTQRVQATQEIRVRTLTKYSYVNVPIDGNSTIQDVKNILSTMKNIPANQQSLHPLWFNTGKWQLAQFRGSALADESGPCLENNANIKNIMQKYKSDRFLLKPTAKQNE